MKPEADKMQIKAEVERLYNVKVVDVNTMRYAGKSVVRYTRTGLVRGRKTHSRKRS